MTRQQEDIELTEAIIAVICIAFLVIALVLYAAGALLSAKVSGCLAVGVGIVGVILHRSRT